MSGTIFISYRRSQDAGFAGRSFDQLERTFRRKALFYRGGSWYSEPGILRSAIRDGVLFDFRSRYLWFRVARTLD